MSFETNRAALLSVSSSQFRVVLLSLALLALNGCDNPSDCPPTNDGGEPPPRIDAGNDAGALVPGITIPGGDIAVRYLGLTDLGLPNGDDVELRWEVLHPPLLSDDELSALPEAGEAQFADIVELHLDREPERTLVRLRLALGSGRTPGSVFTTTMGMRLLFLRAGVPSSWGIAPRSLFLAVPIPGVPPSPRLYTADGRVEIELVIAPDVPSRRDAWVMQLGRTYEVMYRVHNRAASSLRVHVVAAAFRAVSWDEVSTIEPDGSIDVSLPTTPTSLGQCGFLGPGCQYVSAQIEGEETFVDATRRSIVVVP